MPQSALWRYEEQAKTMLSESSLQFSNLEVGTQKKHAGAASFQVKVSFNIESVQFKKKIELINMQLLD